MSSSFSLNGRTSDVWNTGKMFGFCGISRVTVECFSSVARMRYGPSKRGMNLAARGPSPVLYSLRLCSVDRMTQSPSRNGNERRWPLFAWYACEIFGVRRLSCAADSKCSMRWMMSWALGSSLLSSACWINGGRRRGDFPKRSWKGVKPVDALTVLYQFNQLVRWCDL